MLVSESIALISGNNTPRKLCGAHLQAVNCPSQVAWHLQFVQLYLPWIVASQSDPCKGNAAGLITDLAHGDTTVILAGLIRRTTKTVAICTQLCAWTRARPSKRGHGDNGGLLLHLKCWWQLIRPYLNRRRRRSAAAVVPPTKPGWLIGAVPCKIGAPVTGFFFAQGTHQTGCEIAEYRRLCIV